jgi:anti-sigma factor RsiW
MKCSHIKAMISRYVDEDLNPGEMRLLELHVAGCPACREALEQAVAIHKLFFAAERFEAPPGFAGAVMSRIEEKENQPSFWGFLTIHPVFLRTMEVAFVLLIMVIGMISGNTLVANRTPERPQTLQETFSLDVFEPSPPDSIGGIYLALSGENQ